MPRSSQQRTYTKIQKDPTESVKKEARQKLSLLKDAGKIDQQLYFKLKPTDSQAPRSYGLPKIHKPAVSIRPIVSYTNSPLYQLSRYISDILTPYTKLNHQHCKNSNDFSQFIRQQTMDPDEIMVSFDVESLYTNIPITDALLVIIDLLNNDNTLYDRTNLLPDQILELLEFLLRTTFFIFNGEFHQQTDGVAMGGPASSIVAEIYMIFIETTAITTADTPPRIWQRHVDDVFSILRRCNLEQFFQHINSLHPKTKFTMEKEENSTIPLLDTLIQQNQDGTISVKVYRKPTHTDQYLSFTSHHSTRSKQSVITALFNRTENVIPIIQNLNKSNNTLRKSSSPMDTASNSLIKPDDNGILNNKTKTTTNQLKKNLNQSEESISLTSKASVNNLKEHYPSTTKNQNSTKPPHFARFYQAQKTLSQLRKSTTSSTSLIARTVILYTQVNQKEHIKHELDNIYQQSEKLTPNGMKQQTTAGNSTMTSTGQKIRS